jgi:hypothetical protein
MASRINKFQVNMRAQRPDGSEFVVRSVYLEADPKTGAVGTYMDVQQVPEDGENLELFLTFERKRIR